MIICSGCKKEFDTPSYYADHLQVYCPVAIGHIKLFVADAQRWKAKAKEIKGQLKLEDPLKSLVAMSELVKDIVNTDEL